MDTRWGLWLATGVLVAGCTAAPAPYGAVTAAREPPRRVADLLIRDVRIVSHGVVIERGTVVVRGERIERVVAGRHVEAALQVIDGRGMTLLPGFIDTHVHLITGPKPAGRECAEIPAHLQEDLDRILAEGVTTMMSVGDPAAGILEVKAALRSANLFGPDLLVTGPVFAAPGHPGGNREGFCNGQFSVTDAVSVRAEISRLATAGVDAIKVLHDSRWPPKLDLELLNVIVDQAHALSVPVVAHVQTAEDAREVLSAGVDRLVHFPHLGTLDPELLQLIRQRNVPVATTVHLYAPITRAEGSRPVNHGEREIPAARLAEIQTHMEEINVRLRQLQHAGVTLAFGTDRYRGERTQQTPMEHEIETLGRALTPLEVIDTLTINAARFLGLADDIGSIAVGRRADLVLVRGDAAQDVDALNEVEAVIQRGLVVAGPRSR